MGSIFDPNDHHPNSLRHIAFNHHVDPDALRSILEDHSDLEMDNLAKPNPILKLKRSLRSIRSLQTSRHQQCPIMALPIDFQPTPTVTPVVSELSAPVYNNVAIASIIPTNPLFLHIYDLKDHIMWEKTSQKSGGERALSG